jgi:hypothetical protein
MTAVANRPARHNGTMTSTIRRLAVGVNAVLLAIGLGLGATACAGSSSQVQCGSDGCTVTFPRDGTNNSVSVLGVTARLVGVQNNVATVEVAGQQHAIPVGTDSTVNGFDVGVRQVTDSQVVVHVRLG